MFWLAQLGSNIGTWMQTVGAQWLLVDHAHADTLVALVQTATMAPMLLLALPAGVYADIIDRRALLIGTQAIMALIAGLLAALTFAGLASPFVLLFLTFLLGCGAAIMAPAWQAIQPDLVPRSQIPAAAALGGMNINAARAIGPALAGILVGLAGPGVVFALNGVSFLAVVVVLFTWRTEPVRSAASPERVFPALSAGVRYVRHAPGVRRVIARAVLFVLPASALWALLPLVAHDTLHLGSAGYGGLMAALGAGAVVGAFTLGSIRARLSPNQLLTTASVTFALVTAVAAAVHVVPVVAIALFVGGVAWIVVLSTLNGLLQLAVANWVRARALAVYVLLFIGGQGLTSLAWGLLAGSVGLRSALLTSAVLLMVCALSILWWPLREGIGTLDRTPVDTWPVPAMLIEPKPDDGPVLVTVDYRVRADRVEAFVAAMVPVRQSRRRTGAFAWHLYQDVADEERFVEVFSVRSWEEHLRQHQGRTTGFDQELLEEARRLTKEEPVVRHLLPPRTTEALRGE